MHTRHQMGQEEVSFSFFTTFEASGFALSQASHCWGKMAHSNQCLHRQTMLSNRVRQQNLKAKQRLTSSALCPQPLWTGKVGHSASPLTTKVVLSTAPHAFRLGAAGGGSWNPASYTWISNKYTLFKSLMMCPIIHEDLFRTGRTLKKESRASCMLASALTRIEPPALPEVCM